MFLRACGPGRRKHRFQKTSGLEFPAFSIREISRLLAGTIDIAAALCGAIGIGNAPAEDPTSHKNSCLRSDCSSMNVIQLSVVQVGNRLPG
jgi:hypothetical protein